MDARYLLFAPKQTCLIECHRTFLRDLDVSIFIAHETDKNEKHKTREHASKLSTKSTRYCPQKKNRMWVVNGVFVSVGSGEAVDSSAWNNNHAYDFGTTAVTLVHGLAQSQRTREVVILEQYPQSSSKLDALSDRRK